ncbi:GTPase [Galbibacter mesophilus]|uniref:GTPase n=1 Tax=Galbibacter mesophilus TaxID=379069 RepID=UPI00191F5456|nr:GTPase [Galbibacter mesophilus]MCM5661484.1 GTPase [Galbibacter mesophilus]
MKFSKLIFVYNAKGGLWNEAVGAAHKILSPNTYACNLCKLTHGNFKEKEAWKSFRESSEVTMKFFHIEDFQKRYPEFSNTELPAVFSESKAGKVEAFLSSETINAIGSIEELMEVIRVKLKE